LPLPLKRFSIFQFFKPLERKGGPSSRSSTRRKSSDIEKLLSQSGDVDGNGDEDVDKQQVAVAAGPCQSTSQRTFGARPAGAGP